MSERLILRPADRRDAFLDLIRQAKHTIRLSMFRCTDFKILDELAAARSRGVAVELLLTRRAKGWEKKIRELGLYLESMGARVHRFGAPGMKYHAKYMVVDGRIALITSQNLMRRYFERTADFLLLTDDSSCTESLDTLFQWDIVNPGAAIDDLATPRLIVGPEHARERMLAALSSVERSIHIVDHKFTDLAAREAVDRLAGRGVAVEVYGKGALPGMKSHGKAILIDERWAVIGSIALSESALETRRELAITFDDPACVSDLRTFLEEAKRNQAAPSLPDEENGESGEEDDEDDE